MQRLEQVFQMRGAVLRGATAWRSIEEANQVAGEVADKYVLDAALINAAQAEHYEIVRNGSLVAWARQLGETTAPVSCRRRWMRKRSPTRS